MKRTIIFGFVVISLLIATPIAAVFATVSSNSDTVNNYTDNIQVSGTLSGGSVTGYSFQSTGSCTFSYSNYCTYTYFYLAINVLWYYTISGTNTCYSSCSGYTFVAGSTSTTSLPESWSPGTGAASEAYNQGTAGYYHQGSYYQVTNLIDAGLPNS
jgi:hypothetical protein